MKLVVTSRARAQIDHQMRFSMHHHGPRTAHRTFSRVEAYLSNVVTMFPRSGRSVQGPDIYERAVPRTPFVVIYRINEENDMVQLLGYFHHAQDRADFDPESKG